MRRDPLHERHRQPTEKSRVNAHSQETIKRIGEKMIAEKKAAVLAALNQEASGVGKKDIQGSDLLSLLIKSNLASDMDEKSRMSDEDILSRK
jgi:phosphoribosyl-ATP pyrophosphohydrolase